MSASLPFEESIRKIQIFMKVSGINIGYEENNLQSGFKNKIFYIFNIVMLNIDILGAVIWTVLGMIGGTNLTELTFDAPCITFSILGNLKSIFLIIYEDKVRRLIDNLRCMENNERRQKKEEKRVAIRKSVKKLLDIVVKTLSVLNWIICVAFALSPLTLMALNYWKTKELEFLLPFLIVYPFDQYDIRIWPVIYIKQIYSSHFINLDINFLAIVAVFILCAADFLFYIFCAHLSIQLKFLQYDFECILSPSEYFEGIIQYDRKFREKFIELVKWHQILIESIELLEVIYTKSTLYNFVSSSIIICLTGFNVTAIADIALIITFLMFLFMGLLQIYFLCFFGNSLMEESMNISNAVYNSRWYSADVYIRKHLLLVMIRGQKPCKLTASGFAVVNLRAFMKILSTSWSYFALLQSMYN